MQAEKAVGRHILVVEDDPLMAGLLTAALQSAAYQTSHAASGEEALSLLQDIAPDLALLDIHLPGMSGLELAQRLRDETALPFMFLSASTANDIIRQAVEHGAIGYLVKPVKAESLLPAVEAALARADDIRRLRRTETSLTSALAAGRETSIAVGVLMALFQSDRNTAFAVLRDHARSQRRKLNDVAADLLQAAELMNQFKVLFQRHSDE